MSKNPRSVKTAGAAKNQIPMCGLRPLTRLQVRVLPRQWMVGPSSDSRLRPGETPAGASSAADGRACRRPQAAGEDWSAALANAQAATFRTDCRPESDSFSEEPTACGHSRGPIRLDSESDAERNAGSASNAAGDGCGRAPGDKAGLQPYRGKLAVRDETRGRGKRGQDLSRFGIGIRHDARKGRNKGSHWSKPVAPPLHSTTQRL